MDRTRRVFIAGSGGIGRAAALFLATHSRFRTEVVLGDIRQSALDGAKAWLWGLNGGLHDRVSFLVMPELPAALADDSSELRRALLGVDVILDCLPGSCAHDLATLAHQTGCDYANVTEFVEQTAMIRRNFASSERTFLLQTGLAPGYIDLLGMSLIGRLESRFGITEVDSLRLRVGALTQLAEPPTFYSFTWSTEGVATEYVEPAQAIRGGQKTELPALTGSESVFVEGLTLEARLTSGGTADLCEALVGRVRSLDYKTLRYPGHYDWVDRQLAGLTGDEAPAKSLERRMKELVAHEIDDMVVLYAAAEGRGADGVLRRESVSQKVLPIHMTPTLTLSAIQITTAATLAQAAEFLLERRSRSAGGGVLLQSQLPAEEFLSSRLIQLAYDNTRHPEFQSGLSSTVPA